MKKSILSGLLPALLLTSSLSTLADSGATDRSLAFGYQFTQEELDSFPQKTNLPTVYLQIYKTDYDEATDKSTIRMIDGKAELEDLGYIFEDAKKHDWYYRTKITIRDDWGTIKERNEWLGVRGRGNSTWYIGQWTYGGWQPKKPLRLKFDKKADLLTRKENGVEVNDYATDKNWTLLANYYDATLIRNALAVALQKRMGMTFVPASKFVDLVINNQYFGTYQISDHVNIADRRVPINEDTGYFFEGNVDDPNNRFQEDPYIAISFGSYGSGYGASFLLNVKNPDPDPEYVNLPDGNGNLDETKDPKYNDVKAKLSKVATLLYKPETDPNDNWRRYVDLNAAVDAFIVSELSCNYDAAYGNNYFWMENIDSRIVFGPVWDLDLTWNYKIDGKDIKGKHFWEFKYTPFAQLCEKAWNDPYFMKAVYERWQEVSVGLEDFLKQTAQELRDTISQSAALNYTDRYNGGAGAYLNLSSWNDGNHYNSLDDAYTVMNDFIPDRISYVQTEFKAQYDKLGCATLQECTEHDYKDCMFAHQTDGTYRRVCNNCGEVEAEGAVYYYFTVYPESSTTESFYAQSWTPGKQTPNAIATIDVDGSAVPAGNNIYNIVNVRKDAAGNKTCAELCLVDGHPFYSDDKFVAARASYERKVSNTWGTMILPFDLQQAENETASFFHLGEVATDEQGKQTLVMNAIDPADATTAAAGYTPVFFMAKKDSKEVLVTAKNVTVAKVGKKTIWEKSTVEGWTLTGVMQKTQFDVTSESYAANDYYYINSNEFWHATKDLVTNPFRAYLWTPKPQGATARSLRIALAGEASGMQELSTESSLALFAGRGELSVVAPRTMQVTVTNLGGMVMSTTRLGAGERLSMQLPQGVYVVNGVKVIVK